MYEKFIVMVSLVFSVLGSIVSYADEWKQDSNGWQYVYNDGTVLRDNWFEDPETVKLSFLIQMVYADWDC